MLKKRLIPCLDVHAGRVVKGVAFENLVDSGDPAELAERYARDGADEIVLLDITATHEGRGILIETVRRTADRLAIPLSVGGGLRSLDEIRAVLRAGADKVSLNTAAVRDPEFLRTAAAEFGSQCVILAIDAGRDEAGRPCVKVRGGREATALHPVEWARRGAELGAGEILLTVMERDGGGRGYDLELTAAVSAAVPLPIIASGGAGTAAHVVEVLTAGRADGALLAGALHRGELTIPGIKAAMRAAGLAVREPVASRESRVASSARD